MEVLHIAGTNGKGSVATYAANIFGVHHRAGLYSSPHLVDPTERFRMNGEPIRKLVLNKYVAQSQAEREGFPFVHWTHAAKSWLKDEKAEYAVVETGIGGRLDTTNIFDSKTQIITNICFDHMNLLGDTLGEIAAEKSGIIKPGSYVVSARQMPEAAIEVERAVKQMGAKLVVFDPVSVKDYEASLDGQTFSFRHEGLNLRDIHIRALAPGQVENACVAALAAHHMGMPAEDILEGLEQTEMPGRAQLIEEDVVLDVAHNPAAMLELRRVITRNFRGRGVTTLFAAMKDKDIAGMARSVNAFANEVYCTQPDTPRALRLGQYKKYFSTSICIEDPFEATQEAYDRAKRNGDVFVVCGTFYIMKPVLQALGKI